MLERTIQTTRSDLRRTGLRTDVVENIEEESQGTRVIARTLIPFVRPRTISFVGQGFFPIQDYMCFLTELLSIHM